MDNPETVATLSTEDTGRRQTKQIQTKKIDNTGPTKNRYSQIMVSGSCFLLDTHRVAHIYKTLLDTHRVAHIYNTLLDIHRVAHIYKTLLDIHRVAHIYKTLLDIHRVAHIYSQVR
jgi:hypothetical protein